MTTARWLLTRAFYGTSVFLAIAFFYTGFVHAAPVTEKEALEIAEFWYPAEVNLYEQKGWKRQGNESKSDLLASAKVVTVRYLVDKDTIIDKLKGNQTVLAYIVEFSPRGYVVISADDTFTPLLSFDINSTFTWEDLPTDPGHNFMRVVLNSFVNAINTNIGTDISTTGTNPSWTILRNTVSSQKSVTADKKSYKPSVSSTDRISVNSIGSGTSDPAVSEIMLNTPLWSQYNDEVARVDAAGDPIHLLWAGGGGEPPNFPSGVPAGCAQTAFGELLRYYEWPYRGNSSVFHEDLRGNVHSYPETINFSQVTFNWSGMPYGPPNAAHNPDVNTLLYYMGIITLANWEMVATGGDGGDFSTWNSVLSLKKSEGLDSTTKEPKPDPSCIWGYCPPNEYFFCSSSKTWADAQAACYSVGANLVRIDNQNENKCVGDSLTSQWSWIGAYDMWTEGEWYWLDNGAFFWHGEYSGHPENGLYSHWYNGQPDNYGDADCGYIFKQPGNVPTWADDPCSATHGYVCERHLDSERLLPPTRDSIVRGLPVILSYGPHVVVADGYRETIPSGDDPDTHLYMNIGGEGLGNAWYSTYNIFNWNVALSVFYNMTPTNYIYVDNTYGGNQDGGPITPYSTIAFGIAYIPAISSNNPKGGRLWIRAGTYTGTANYPIDFYKPMEVTSYLGDINIGNRFYLKSSGMITINTGGDLKVN